MFLTSDSSAFESELGYKKFPVGYDFYTDRFQFMSGGGADRCVVRDCLCKASKPPFVSNDKWVTGTRRYSVYFEESDYISTPSSYDRLEQFLKSYPPNTAFSIVGYTDDCGTHAYNSKLVRKRVAEIRSRMAAVGYRRASTISFEAEAGRGHDPASRRVDVIAHTQSRVTTVVDKVQADVYLIDASGSMWSGWRTWSNLVAASFKPGSKIYLSVTDRCAPGARLDLVSPSGGTEIWYSYWRVIDYMEQGQTLAIISDFKSDVPLTHREADLISMKVSKKGIKVIAVTP